ncbi:unnamed protein product [Heterosigma akashiwo]
MGGQQQAAGDKKKKKKKPKAKKEGDGEEKKEETAKPKEKDAGKKGKQSAAAKKIAQRLVSQAAEEELRRRREEEEARIRAEEEAEAAEARRAEEEKERKRLAKQAKKEKAKAEGKYLTKAQKAAAARNAAALEAMKAAGLVPTGGEAPKKDKPVYGKKKKPSPRPEQRKAAEEAEEAGERRRSGGQPEAAEGRRAGGEPAAVDDWEAAGEDDWEAAADTWESNIGTSPQRRRAGAPPGRCRGLGWGAGGRRAGRRRRRRGGRAEARSGREGALGVQGRRLLAEEERLAREAEERALAEQMERERVEAEMKKEAARRRRLAREAAALEARHAGDLRCPVICIMGHVDTGKTKLLDNIRRTNVQEGEAGGITQQIGATFFSRDTLDERINAHGLRTASGTEINVPGVLIIDTPGHEAFTNLRSRGSNLCDIAILVIDLMHGLEPQTLESISLLRRKRTPFIVALNKVDRLYNWKSETNLPIRQALEKQEENTVQEFRDRMQQVRRADAPGGAPRAALLRLPRRGLVHAVLGALEQAVGRGRGQPEGRAVLVHLGAADGQEEAVEGAERGAVLGEPGPGHRRVPVPHLGHHRRGPAVSRAAASIVVRQLTKHQVHQVLALLTPPPNRELRIKSEYIHHKILKAAIGVKISAQQIEKVVAGTSVMVVGPDDDVEDIKEEVMKDMSVMSSLKMDPQGVMVQASTLGALEALLEFLRNECNPPSPSPQWQTPALAPSTRRTSCEHPSCWRRERRSMPQFLLLMSVLTGRPGRWRTSTASRCSRRTSSTTSSTSSPSTWTRSWRRGGKRHSQLRCSLWCSISCRTTFLTRKTPSSWVWR